MRHTLSTTLLAVILTLVCSAQAAIASPGPKLMLFGGRDHKQYLGCIVCNEFSSDSICNGFGKYGNEFSTEGMFQEFSGFGNDFSPDSPWNESSASTGVPVLVDENGAFYGYFTINDSRSDAVKFSHQLHLLYEQNDKDLEKVRKGICHMFGNGS